MSYDVHLFPPGHHDDLAAAYERLEDDAGPPDPRKEERKRWLAERLQSLQPALVETQRDFEAIAVEERISEQRARWENREIELIALVAGQAVQVVLFDDGGAYSYGRRSKRCCSRTRPKGAAPTRAFRALRRYVFTDA